MNILLKNISPGAYFRNLTLFCKLYRTTIECTVDRFFFGLLQIQYPMLPTEQDPKILLTTFELETTREIGTFQSIDDFHQIKVII